MPTHNYMIFSINNRCKIYDERKHDKIITMIFMIVTIMIIFNIKKIMIIYYRNSLWARESSQSYDDDNLTNKVKE